MVNDKNVDQMYEKYVCLRRRYGQPFLEKSPGVKSIFSREKVFKNQDDAYTDESLGENESLKEEEPLKKEEKKRRWW